MRDEISNLLSYAGTSINIIDYYTNTGGERQHSSSHSVNYSFFHDPLTGFSNRGWLLEQLERCMVVAVKNSRRCNLAVLFVDLDRFKLINDCWGYSFADQLLVAIAQRLKTYLRPEDAISRVGGDEFAILLNGTKTEVEAIQMAQKICQAFASPFVIAGNEVFTAVSIGIAFSTNSHTYIPEDLLRYADIAMCHAKQMGSNNYTVFEPAMLSLAVARLQLETDLRLAIHDIGRQAESEDAQNLKVSPPQSLPVSSCLCIPAPSTAPPAQQLQLHYQPIVSITTGELTGFEALLRWLHPKRGWVSPSTFIPVAEETGLIIPLGEWVLWQACRQLRYWQNQFQGTQPLVMSVNLSCKQLSSPHLVTTVANILHTYNLSGSSLKLEITETVLMENPESISSTLTQLKHLGIQLSIDDFGIGYSSLSRLHALPIDTLKIDRSFISGDSNIEEKSQIVQAIVAMAHYLGMDVVAEGVETPGQLAKLKALECEYAQGFLFSQPVGSEAVAVWMTQQQE